MMFVPKQLYNDSELKNELQIIPHIEEFILEEN